MSNRLDALSARESNGKAYFTKIGAAFPNRDGKGFSVLLDAVPAPIEGQFKILLREPLPKDGARPQQSQPPADDLDDQIPF
ncbi:MAG: hypothetical protein AAGB23_05345 [Pseudomonadota bacterium]